MIWETRNSFGIDRLVEIMTLPPYYVLFFLQQQRRAIDSNTGVDVSMAGQSLKNLFYQS